MQSTLRKSRNKQRRLKSFKNTENIIKVVFCCRLYLHLADILLKRNELAAGDVSIQQVVEDWITAGIEGREEANKEQLFECCATRNCLQ